MLLEHEYIIWKFDAGDQNNVSIFQIIWFRTTNDDGRMGDFIECEEFSKGIFKMVFNTKPYFTKSNTTTFYPYVEVIL